MKKYKILGCSEYFKNKYGTSNPTFELEGNWKELTGTSWGESQGNPACLIFAIRSAKETHVPDDDEGIVYGKIGGLGEIVHMSELERLEGDIPFAEALEKL